MQLLYWQDQGPTGFHGTIQAKDGHVFLRDIPSEARSEYDVLINQELANSLERLPPSTREVCEFLEAKGCPRVDFNPPLIGYGPIQEVTITTAEDLQRLKLDTLKERAAELGLTGLEDAKTKAPVIEAILEAEAAARAAEAGEPEGPAEDGAAENSEDDESP